MSAGRAPDGYPSSLPAAHRGFLDPALERLASNPAVAGVVAAGSFGTDTMDEHSDLDLVLGIEPDALEIVMADRTAIAESLGPLLVAFTGEHVGEPRLLICLYDPPLLHVDLKFVAIDEIGERVGPVRLLFDRDGRARARIRGTAVAPPGVDGQWIEDRFWVWVHYIGAKVARGEIMEAVGGLAMLRKLALGPLLHAGDAAAAGVRRVETAAPDRMPALRRTVARPEPASCLEALRAAVALYRELRERNGSGGTGSNGGAGSNGSAGSSAGALERRAAAEAAATRYLERIAGRS